MFHAHKTEFSEKGWMGMFKVVDTSQDDKKGADVSSVTAESPTNVSVFNNQTNLVPGSIHNEGKYIGLKTNEMLYSLASYKVNEGLFHPSQNYPTHPNNIIPSYQYGTNSSQGATR